MKFKYDYNNFCRNILILFFLATSIINFVLIFKKNLFSITILIISIVFLLGAISFHRRGILIDYKKHKLVIFDYFWTEKINLENIISIEVNEIKKKNKGNKSFLSLLFIHNALRKEEIEMHDYVYNNGKVFNIKIKIKSKSGGYSVYKSYFGWMYKEKNKNKVIAVENQLYEFIDNINFQIKEKIIDS